jgi:hypothetical protein
MSSDVANFTSLPEDFEIVELDQNTHLTDEERSWPVTELVQEEDFAIEEPLPVLVMTPTLGHTNDQEKGFPTLITAVSNYEVSLGGEGLHLFDLQHTNELNGNGSIALIPWKADGARGRLEQVARWVVEIGKFATKANVA